MLEAFQKKNFVQPSYTPNPKKETTRLSRVSSTMTGNINRKGLMAFKSASNKEKIRSLGCNSPRSDVQYTVSRMDVNKFTRIIYLVARLTYLDASLSHLIYRGSRYSIVTYGVQFVQKGSTAVHGSETHARRCTLPPGNLSQCRVMVIYIWHSFRLLFSSFGSAQSLYVL